MGKLIENMLKAIPATGYRTYLVSALALVVGAVMLVMSFIGYSPELGVAGVLLTLEALRGIFNRAAVANLEQKVAEAVVVISESKKIENDNTSLVRGDTK